MSAIYQAFGFDEKGAYMLMSGELAPLYSPDPRGIRRCNLRLIVEPSTGVVVKAILFGLGPVESVPTRETE